MPEFEEIFKVIVIMTAVLGLPAILYLGFRWARAGIRMFERETSGAGAANEHLLAEIDALRTRLVDLEAGQAHVGELEERLDFTERLLARSREPGRIED